MKSKLKNFATIAILIAFPGIAYCGSGKPVLPQIDKVVADLSAASLTITGTNLSGPTVILGNMNLTVTSSTATSIVATLPASITSGSYHLIVSKNSGGAAALDIAIDSNGDLGNENTATGYKALFSNTTGQYNTANGFQALRSNTEGAYNTAIGDTALLANTTGVNNTAAGFEALYGNDIGVDNTATGFQALLFNTSGNNNTANGFQALHSNSTGDDNTAVGRGALYNNTKNSNTAMGRDALFANTDGEQNTAVGLGAGGSNIGGNYNSAIGFRALFANPNGTANTAVGALALENATGSNNIALGQDAGNNLTTGDSNIDIFDVGVAGESGTIRIGTSGIQTATFIAGISGSAVAGSTVVVDANGQLGVAPSSQRFKHDIQPMDKTSEAILSLRPVTFRYQCEIDPKDTPQFGMVAEEVEKVDPDLVARDAEGKVYTVRYEAVNAMLLNEFLKEHRKVEALEATVEQLKAQIQRVSDKVELNQPAPRTVDNR